MFRSLLLVCLIISTTLSACAPVVQAQDASRSDINKPSPVGKIVQETVVPEAKQTSSPTADRDAAGTYESSVLVVESINGRKGASLYPLDPIRGQALPGYEPIQLGDQYYYAFSPDRRTLAIASIFTGIYPLHYSLLLLDVNNWQAQVFELEPASYISAIDFSPDGRRVAIVSGDQESKVVVFDCDRKAVTADGSLDFLASRMNFTVDGRALMVYGMTIVNRFTENEMTSGSPKVALLNAEDLSLRWSSQLEGVRDGIYPKDGTQKSAADLHQPGAGIYYFPGLAFAPDRDVLYVIHADREQLTTVDFDAQSVQTVEVRSEQSWLEKLLSLGARSAYAKVAEGTYQQAVISPDGSRLYLVSQKNELMDEKSGDLQVKSTPLGLDILRTSDGRRLFHLETDANELSISPDGGNLYLRSLSGKIFRTEVFDTRRMDVIASLAGMWLKPATSINGRLLLVSDDQMTGTRQQMAVVDPNSLEVLNQWSGSPYIAWLYSP